MCIYNNLIIPPELREASVLLNNDGLPFLPLRLDCSMLRYNLDGLRQSFEPVRMINLLLTSICLACKA